MNGSNTPWFAKGQEADYIAAFRRVVGIFRRYSDQFSFDWCPSWGPQDNPADLTYPGDDVVDYVGLDIYDFRHEGTPEHRWKTFYRDAPFGLEWHRAFASAHNKPMSYPEWGVGQFGDNPYFVQKMREWLFENRDRIAYAAYFNVDGDWPTQIDTGRFPKSQARFRKLFSR
jgi:beta-mannanase